MTPFTRNDVVAIGTLIGAVFGAGGGNEARERGVPRRAAAAARRGEGARASGTTSASSSIRRTPVTVAESFPYGAGPTGVGPGNVALDAGQLLARGPARPHGAAPS